MRPRIANPVANQHARSSIPHHDTALDPVERDISAITSTGAHSAWSGWLTAAALLVTSTAHYMFVHQPLSERLQQADRVHAKALEAHDAREAALSSALDETRAELARTVAAATQEKAAAEAAEAEVIERAVKRRAQQRTRSAIHKKTRSARRSRQAQRALSQSAKTKTTAASSQHGPSDGLEAVISASNDPLKGL